MTSKLNRVQIFNLETMSGVFPGTRTRSFQRLRLQHQQSREDATDLEGEWLHSDISWAQLHWYDEPSACVLFATSANGSPVTAPTPLLRIENPQQERVLANLVDTLAPLGHRPMCCGTCHFLALSPDKTQEGLPSGRCQWQATRSVNADPEPAASQLNTEFPLLEHQSVLALNCDHWQPRSAKLDVTGDAETASTPLPPLPKAAESSARNQPLWRQLWSSFRTLVRLGSADAADRQPASAVPSLVERSGVGAGTEPCFVCQGRLANLSALVVETAEGDKETYSLWRCRNCYSYFLSDWVDRWERLDNLETEEHHYRLAPFEAGLVLGQSGRLKHSEHPAGRQNRTAQRRWFQQFLGEKEPISHQIKLGR